MSSGCPSTYLILSARRRGTGSDRMHVCFVLQGAAALGQAIAVILDTVIGGVEGFQDDPALMRPPRHDPRRADRCIDRMVGERRHDLVGADRCSIWSWRINPFSRAAPSPARYREHHWPRVRRPIFALTREAGDENRRRRGNRPRRRSPARRSAPPAGERQSPARGGITSCIVPMPNCAGRSLGDLAVPGRPEACARSPPGRIVTSSPASR